MRLRSLIVVAALSISGLALAQNDAAQTPAPDQNAPAVAQAAPQRGALQLSAEQKQQMKAIRESARDKAAIIRHDSTLTAAQQDEKLKALRASTREQVKAVLTPDQQKAAEQMRANRKARLAEKLGLTADQQAKMKETLTAAKQQRESVLNNNSLSQDEKATQLKQIRESTRTQMSQILTPEQMKKIQRFRGMRHMHGRGGMGPAGM